MAMNQGYLYTSDDIKSTYEQVHDLLLTRYIIKTYSTNKSDIRDIALNGINLGNVKKVLELGCGYGFFIEKLKGKLNDGSIIIGIDMVENNREPFIHSVESIQYKGEFITGSAEIIRNMTKGSFDMIITSYSLYFFPYLLNEIAATLAPDGVFIAITHSQNTLREILQFLSTCMVKTGNRQDGKLIISRLFDAFSLEEGKEQLEKYFNRVEQMDYRNSIVVPHPNIND
jgi:SAM-dependent methyltransferase